MYSRRLLNPSALAALFGILPGLSAAQSPSDARWQVTQSGNGTRYLTLSATASVPGQPDAHMNTGVNDWTLDTHQFTFGTWADSQAARSTERTVLQALAHDADSLRITITHPRDPGATLAVQVPVAARRGDFKALLEGLK